MKTNNFLDFFKFSCSWHDQKTKLKQIGEQRLQSMVAKVDLYSLDFENVTKAKALLQGLTHVNVKRASKPLGQCWDQSRT